MSARFTLRQKGDNTYTIKYNKPLRDIFGRFILIQCLVTILTAYTNLTINLYLYLPKCYLPSVKIKNLGPGTSEAQTLTNSQIRVQVKKIKLKHDCVPTMGLP